MVVARNFSLLKMPRPDLEHTVPPNQCVLLGVKWPGCEVNYPPPLTAEVTNEWSYTFTPLHVFMAQTGKTLPLLEPVTTYTWSFFMGTDVLTCLREQCD